MELTRAKDLSLELMRRHGLISSGWKFEWMNRKRTLGRCCYHSKTIWLSVPYATHNSDVEIRDTILHEIAHALVGLGHGHDRVWKGKCREIGAIPNRCSITTTMPKGRYVFVYADGPKKGQVVSSRYNCPDIFAGWKTRTTNEPLNLIDTRPFEPNSLTRSGKYSQQEYLQICGYGEKIIHEED